MWLAMAEMPEASGLSLVGTDHTLHRQKRGGLNSQMHTAWRLALLQVRSAEGFNFWGFT